VNPHDAELLSALRQALRPYLHRSDATRRLASVVGRWLIAESEGASPAVPLDPAGPIAAATPAPPPATAPPRAVVIAPARTGPLAIVPLRLGDTTITVPVRGAASDITRAVESAERAERPDLPRPLPPDLALIRTRARLKAESCRVFIERRAAAGDPEREPPLVSRVAEMITEAKALPGCFLWVFFREKPQPADDGLRRIAECYDALADAAELVSELQSTDQSAPTAESFRLLAEASSALRVALEKTWLTSPDADQDQAHAWLRAETDERGIFVPRHMRLDDPAEPSQAADLRRRVAAVLEQHRARQSAQKQAGKLLNQARYHAHQIVEKPPEESGHDWSKLSAAITALAAAGIQPEDQRVLDAVASLRGREPADADPLLRRALAPPPPEEPDEPMPERGWSERVAEVRGMLAGRRVVVIGGEARPEAVARIEEAFGLAGCDWVRLNEHGSGRAMAAPIAQPDTALVLVLIKLTGHLHADEAREYARSAGKPLVILKAGYNPEQIAQAVLDQAALSLTRAN
jgi:hypothetical protein